MEKKSKYVDPITCGCDMVIRFEKYEDTKLLAQTMSELKVFGSWFGNSIYFFKKDHEKINQILKQLTH
jgi:hypothetical protein